MITNLCELNITRVAVVDDDPENLEAFAYIVQTCRCEAVRCSIEFGSMSRLVENVTKIADGVLCDHRLSYKSHASFTGAEAVARWFDMKFPAILISAYDFDATIKLHRRKIPVVIPKHLIDITTITEGFNICTQEIRNVLPPFRKPRRAFVEIVGFDPESKIQLVEAFVPQWNPLKAVRFPRSLMGELASVDLEPGMMFIADVNIDARNVDELFFENFELAPEPDPNDGLA